MKTKIVYNNIKDKELIELIHFSTPFFIEYIDNRTKNGKKEMLKLKSEFAFVKLPFIVVYDDEDNYLASFYSEDGNACQQFIKLYQ